MKVLLFGNGNSVFTNNLSKWLTIYDPSISVDILSIEPIKPNNKSNFHSCYTVTDSLLYRKILSKIKVVKTIYRVFWQIKLIRKLPEYDIVNFHFITIESHFLLRAFKKHTTSKIVYSIWGSDFYRTSKREIKNLAKHCFLADKITFTNSITLENFKKAVNWEKDNLETIRFGISPLQNLKKLDLTKNECKAFLNWNSKKIAITIGNSSDPHQNHEKIIDQFLSPELLHLRDKVQLVFPLTYGNKLYREKIISKIEMLPYEYKIYLEFLPDQEVAIIRKATDVMINLQNNDQFSGAMQEHLFAGNLIITGSWLPYEILKENGVFFFEINGISELSHILPNIVKNIQNFETQVKKNPVEILKLSDWEVNIDKWVKLYRSLAY